jgi:hypothetical protein
MQQQQKAAARKLELSDKKLKISCNSIEENEAIHSGLHGNEFQSFKTPSIQNLDHLNLNNINSKTKVYSKKV